MVSDKINAAYEALMDLKLFEVCELLSLFEEKHGPIAVAAASPVAAGAGAGEGSAAAEKSSFNVILKAAGSKKVELIKSIKEITGLSLMEAKKLADADSAVIKENVSKDEAEGIKKKIEDAGGTVDMQ